MKKYTAGAVKALPVKAPPVKAPPVKAPPVEAPPVGFINGRSSDKRSLDVQRSLER